MTMADIQTLTKEKIKLDEPGLYDVILSLDKAEVLKRLKKI